MLANQALVVLPEGTVFHLIGAISVVRFVKVRVVMKKGGKGKRFKNNILPEPKRYEVQGDGCREAVRIIDPSVELALFFNRCGLLPFEDIWDFGASRRMDAKGKRVDNSGSF